MKHYKGPYYAFAALFVCVYGYMGLGTFTSGDIISMVLYVLFGLIFSSVLFLMLRFIFGMIDNERARDQHHNPKFESVNKVVEKAYSAGWNSNIEKEVLICHTIGLEVFVNPECSMDAGIEFENSGMKFMSGNRKITGYQSFGLITPRIDNVSLNLSNVVFHETSGDKKKKVEATIAAMTFRKSFEGRYYLMPDVFEMGGGNFLSKKIQSVAASAIEKITGYKEIRLENPEFEEHYMLFGKDDIESRYLMSTNLMERLTTMAKRIGHTPHISFEDNKVFLRLDKSPKLNWNQASSKHHFSQVHSFYEEIKSIAQLIAETKGIWKE